MTFNICYDSIINMIDEHTKKMPLSRLKKIEGQIKGIERRIEEGKYWLIFSIR